MAQGLDTSEQFLTAGVNLKFEHHAEAVNYRSEGMWYEVHTENYFVGGGLRKKYLREICDIAPVSFHGVGASLGSPGYPTASHLESVKRLVNEFNPIIVSEHSTWNSYNNQYFADLIPLPKTMQALKQLEDGVDAYQNAVGRKILIENPSNYCSFKSEMDEPEFLIEVANRTGCGLLLDVNNLFISKVNTGLDPLEYIKAIPPQLIGELHVAGFDPDPNFPENSLLIDSHGSEVSEPVWRLLETVLSHVVAPVILERDANIPNFEELIRERDIAHQVYVDSIQKT